MPDQRRSRRPDEFGAQGADGNQRVARASGMMSPMSESPVPLRVVNAVVPIRICDNGGWTDTWFAGHGKVFNIGVLPQVEVQVRIHPIGALPDRILLDAENCGERYTFAPGVLPDRHPLLEAAIDDFGLPDDVSIEVSVYSDAPVGCSTGTSASLVVALLGALDALTPGRMTPHEIAYAAHRIEVDRLGIQSGIQDQLCAAYGGVNYIEIPAYPHALISQLALPNTVLWELERRLVLVFLGRAHVSSEVHDWVIASLEREGETSPHLEALRRAAEHARDGLSAADFSALGRAMTDNTEAQGQLHPDLVNKEAQAAIADRGRKRSVGMEGKRSRWRGRERHAPLWAGHERQATVDLCPPRSRPAIPNHPDIPQSIRFAGLDSIGRSVLLPNRATTIREATRAESELRVNSCLGAPDHRGTESTPPRPPAWVADAKARPDGRLRRDGSPERLASARRRTSQASQAVSTRRSGATCLQRPVSSTIPTAWTIRDPNALAVDMAFSPDHRR